ncbi:desampylase [Rhizomicrobium palustre]
MLILPAPLKTQLFVLARTAHPRECCGLLEGVREGEAVRVTALYPSPNLSPTPETAFEIDPALHFALQRNLRGTGRSVVGCYHSHPTGKAEPSPRDRANGCEAGWIWVILATGVIIEGAPSLGAFLAPGFELQAIATT